MSTSEWFGPWGEPSLSVLYGDAGLGKSTDLARACCTGIIFAPPSGIKPALTVLGFKPMVLNVQTVQELMEAIVWAAKQYPHVKRHGIDDFSVVAASTYKIVEAQYPGKNTMQRYGEVYRIMTDFREVVKRAGVDFVMTAHVQMPYVNERTNTFEKGGPQLPTKPLTPLLPYVCDNAFLVEADPGRKPHPARFSVDVEGKFLVKDRDNAAPTFGPVNLAEVKRAAGYSFPRLQGLEWQDDAAAEVVDLAEGDPNKARVAVAKVAQRYLDRGHAIEHVRWAVFDGADRVEIRANKRAEQLAQMGIGSGPILKTGIGVGFRATPPSAAQAAQPAAPAAPPAVPAGLPTKE